MRNDGCFNNKTDIKIFILFLLDGIDYPVDYTTLNNIIAESGYVGMFDFAECLSELVELSHILEDRDGAESCYMISETGRLVAYELRDSILESIREKSSMVAARILSLQRKEIRTQVTVKEENRRVCLSASMSNKNGIIFSFTLYPSSMPEAERIREKFTNSPDEIYRAFLSMATGKIDYYIK